MGFNFRGQVPASEAAAKAAGDLDVRASSGMRLATLAGPGAAAASRRPARERAGSSSPWPAGSIGIDKLALQIGESKVSGQIKLTARGERRRIEARLDVDETTLARLLGPVLDQQFAIADQAEAAIRAARASGPTPPSAPPSSTASRGRFA